MVLLKAYNEVERQVEGQVSHLIKVFEGLPQEVIIELRPDNRIGAN